MTGRLGASFRDPAGFVFRQSGSLYRQVNDTYRPDYDLLLSSGLYDALTTQRLLIDHVEAAVAPLEPLLGSLVIQPRLVPFVSYPYEWCPGQLLEAAELTLEIQRLAVEHGMTLRDASAYNIQFAEGAPVLIDTLSFSQLEDRQPWLAYGQFCRHFLAPLALVRHKDVRLMDLLRVHLDGVPLDLTAKLLPRRTRLSPGLGVHIHAHAASQQRHATGSKVNRRGAAPSVSAQARDGLLESLRATVRKQRWEPEDSAWRDYYASAESYARRSSDHKAAVVKDFLHQLNPRTVWDLGANTGRYSHLASTVTNANVISFEMDPSAVEVAWRESQRAGNRRVLPLRMDLTNPTPAQGWAHEERTSLRLRGPSDTVLALAVVHHLAIGNNVPLPVFSKWLSSLGRTAILEWIPKEDPMVQKLLNTREDIFEEYTSSALEAALSNDFSIELVKPIHGSVRSLYLLRARGAHGD